MSVNHQIEFMESQLLEFAEDENKLWKAYKAEVFDEVEYAAKRKEMKQSVATITSELRSLREQVRTEADIAVQKQIILKAAEEKASGLFGGRSV